MQAQEQEEWQSRVVVDSTVFKATGHLRAVPGQTDRLEPMLKGVPLKESLKQTYVGQAPVSMYLEEAWKERGLYAGSSAGGLLAAGLTGSGAAGGMGQSIHGVDFVRHIAKAKSTLHKPGLDQSWNASLHDCAM